MSIDLKPVQIPAFLKVGFFGETGTGKTWTAAKVLSQFIAEFCPHKQLAIYDTEPAAGYIKAMVKAITGKELIAVHSRSFSDLLEFARECNAKGYVAMADSITHPWRSLCKDYLDAKKSRIKSAGGRVETAKLSLADWGPIKDMWNAFSELYCYDPVHWCLCGREGDRWEDVENAEGELELKKTGVKMKTETELGYEPSLLVRMKLMDTTKHVAFVVKDRFDALTGCQSEDKPDIEFFRPHLAMLNLGGKGMVRHPSEPVFAAGEGPNWETILARREAVLENIKDDLVLAYPGRSDAEKVEKTKLVRAAFGTSSWKELEKDTKQFPLERLQEGRQTIIVALRERKAE
ncbi:MAG: hypothetical protein IMZ71_03535 [Chloroflexi bacterium]|nr:hypothetical protein [Chloroflexota bacterium]